MSDHESKAPIIIQNLLHQDLQNRKKGLQDLKADWMIEYREYLWMAIEGEENKPFQAEMVLFALNQLKERSLRKMIRFVEKDQLHPSAMNRLLDSYLLYETEEVREALLKSLNRTPSYTYKFVLKLLNQRELYQLGNVSPHLIEDVLSEQIPDHYRKEFVIRIINNYLQSHRSFLKRIKIWDIITSDSFLHFTVLRAFYNAEKSADLEIVKPKMIISPTLLTTRRGVVQYANRNDPIIEWYNYPRRLQFLYQSRLSTDERIVKEFVHIIHSADILPLDINPTMDGELESLYLAWDVLVDHLKDPRVLELEEITPEQFSLLEVDDEVEASSYFHWVQELHINPHALFAQVLNFLPRFYLLDQILNPRFPSTHLHALQALADHKYWITDETKAKVSSNTLEIQYFGPKQFWINILDHCISLILEDTPIPLQEAAIELIYTLLDLLEPVPELDNFYQSLQNKISKIDAIIDLEAKDPNAIFTEILDELDFHITRLQDAQIADVELLQTYLEHLVQATERSVQAIQELIDQTLAAQGQIGAQERELIKIGEQLDLLADLNYWYDLVLYYVQGNIQATTKKLDTLIDRFEQYSKQLGTVSESISQITKVIGDPREVDLNNTTIIPSVGRTFRNMKSNLQSLSSKSSPFSYIDGDANSSISSSLHKLQAQLVYSINIDTLGQVLEPVRAYLDIVRSNFSNDITSPAALLLGYRLRDIEEIDVSTMSTAQLRLLLSYVLSQIPSQMGISHLGSILEYANEEVQSYGLGLFDQYLKFGLYPDGYTSELTEMIKLFQQSDYVSVRTKARLLSID